MTRCVDCGTILRDGICPNCSEELYIYVTQRDYLPEKLSEEFINKVKEQDCKERQTKGE